jgi:hypothetical protein
MLKNESIIFQLISHYIISVVLDSLITNHTEYFTRGMKEDKYGSLHELVNNVWHLTIHGKEKFGACNDKLRLK